MKESKLFNLKMLVSMTVADVDIFLLQNEEQTADNDKESFSREEIREQLSKTVSNLVLGLEKAGFDTDKPLIPDKLISGIN
ncbi:hypothetical protein [Chondrinema litorale]|uniref:hypothetical protein n=1 Tax=Chondrinema litorale TaxID=2994555 RepID=UPI002542C370|nr:hypothetical protein [Chondrinema litorale]UZR99559.1 hypothetical protein OQ292_37480 [Chondrinema litorale]